MADAIVDRLISGAGAVAAGADELTRGFGGDSDSRLLRGRPGSALVAIICFVLAGLLLAVGAENRDPALLSDLSAGPLAHDDTLGQRTSATVDGSIASLYVESYLDLNGNDRHDADEVADAWYYWIVDPADHRGVTVRSERPPAEVFTARVRGEVFEDRDYVAEDIRVFGDDARHLGLALDPTKVVDVRDVPGGTATPIDFHQPIPSDGTIVEVSGSRLPGYLPICDTDPNNDDVCQDSEADAWDFVVYDPDSKRAITVVTDVSPEFTPVSLHGVLRRDEHSVDGAIQTGGREFSDADLEISPHYLLDEALAQSDPRLAVILAAAFAALGAVILIGLAGRYLIFRRTQGLIPAGAATLAPGERLPLRVTGPLRTPAGRIHVREQAADLVRFVVTPGDPPVTTLIVERTGRPQGIPVGSGEARRVAIGKVYPLRGTRPAIRLAAPTGVVLLSFDDAGARDRAAAELLSASSATSEPSGPAAPPDTAPPDTAPPDTAQPDAASAESP